MDIAALSMNMSMTALYTEVSTSIMGKAMDQGTQCVAQLLGDMAAANPSPAVLAPKAGSMDILI